MLTFIKQSMRDFRNTGSLAPSSSFLGRAMASILPRPMHDDFRVLEVGSGTGSVTCEIIKQMNGGGYLDLWEISPAFCEVLRARILEDRVFKAMAGRIHVSEGDIRALKRQPKYNAVISGLPFNCFSPAEVRDFLEHFRALIKPGGTLTWFEYVAIRKLQSPFVGRARRTQLKGICEVTRGFAREHHYQQQIIPINFPPARVLHLKFG